jgi:hypothetical protein
MAPEASGFSSALGAKYKKVNQVGGAMLLFVLSLVLLLRCCEFSRMSSVINFNINVIMNCVHHFYRQ